MPQPRPPYRPGNYYHIYNRGCHKMPLFHVHDDYLAALTKMRKYVLQFSLTLIAYCLMPNHYHFLIRQDAAFRAGLFPQRVFNSYAKKYNRRYNHSGTLFEDNYKVKLVDKTSYLHHLCRYIHANPVKDGLVCQPEDWIYSNYREWIGLRNDELVDKTFISEHFATPETYQRYVADYITTKRLPAEINK